MWLSVPLRWKGIGVGRGLLWRLASFRILTFRQPHGVTSGRGGGRSFIVSACFKEQQQEVDLFERQSSLWTHYVQARTSTVNVDCKLPWFTRSGVLCEGTLSLRINKVNGPGAVVDFGGYLVLLLIALI